MPKNNHLEDYQLFFMEIPSQTTDGLDDIQIIDAKEEASQQPCLRDDQVSQISSDLMDYQKEQPVVSQPKPVTDQRQLFDN